MERKGVVAGMKRRLSLILLVLLLTMPAGWTAPKEMTLKVREPGEAANFTVGAANTIKWSYRGELGQNVEIRLQRVGWVNARMTLSEAAPLGAKGSGSFKWNTPADLPPGGKYTVTVKAENGIGDMSGEFTLTAGKTPVTQIELVDPPKGGDRWTPGAPVTIQWKYSGSPGQMVRLALIKKAEGSVTEITASVPIGVDGKGSYEWKVPALKAGADYYVGIVSTSNAFYQNLGSNPVSITATR